MIKQHYKDNLSRVKARKMMKKLYPDLKENQVIHHKDGNPMNNSIENLQILSYGEHQLIHSKSNLPIRKPNRVNGIATMSVKNIPCNLWDRLKDEAKKQGLIFNYFIVQILTKAIDEIEKNNK